jgi:hypothetical protein
MSNVRLQALTSVASFGGSEKPNCKNQNLSLMPDASISKYALFYQLCPEGNEVRVIDSQHTNRGSGAAGSSQQHRAVPSKMAFPMLLPWMKQWHELTAHWINARDVGSFMFIAMQATPRQILNNRRSTMLLGDDVVHLERQWVVHSRQMTVLAPVPCDLAEADAVTRASSR